MVDIEFCYDSEVIFNMAFQGDSIYWVEVEKVVPNPFQPRRDFDQNKLQELADSIRMYGVLQPLTVTRREVQREDGTFYSEYELIAGERRLRASKLAGIAQVPVIIRDGEQSEQEKLELAIIENLQREDLNAVDRAIAFKQLTEQFGLSHAQVAQKMGRSREYVSNSIRLLALPTHMLDSLKKSDIMEGHARTLLMLNDRPEEQEVVHREILLKKMSVREVERIVRKIATDKIRKKSLGDIDASLIELEKKFTETLGTRVQILKTDFGGKLTIDYFSEEDLETIFNRIKEDVAQQTKVVEQNIATQISSDTPLMIDPVFNKTPDEVVSQNYQNVPQSSIQQRVVPVEKSPHQSISEMVTNQSNSPYQRPVSKSETQSVRLEDVVKSKFESTPAPKTVLTENNYTSETNEDKSNFKPNFTMVASVTEEENDVLAHETIFPPAPANEVAPNDIMSQSKITSEPNVDITEKLNSPQVSPPPTLKPDETDDDGSLYSINNFTI